MLPHIQWDVNRKSENPKGTLQKENIIQKKKYNENTREMCYDFLKIEGGNNSLQG